jgi:subtilisin family serine protease
MNYKLLAFIIAFSFIKSSIAQQATNSIGIWNEQILSKETSETKIEILVKGNKKNILDICKKYDANFLYNINDLCRVSITKKNLEAFAKESSIQRIGQMSRGGVNLMDTARILNNVDSVYMGYAPLTRSYAGSGIVMGFIDDGIDFKNFDFKNEDSTTRIKFIWDQNFAPSALSPLPYNYGKEWNFMDINNGLCTHEEQGSAGHGTHVTGIATGNGNINPNFRGNAPSCDIIAVSIKYGTSFLTNVIDAADYIFKKADAMGKPCVINTSLGDYYGARDGKDLTSQALEFLMNERPGRIIVAAAGNAGNIPYHARYNFTGTDTIFSFFKDRYTGTKYYFDFWADTASFKNAYFTVEARDDSTYDKLGNTGYINILRDMPTLPFVSTVNITRNIISPLGFFMGQVKYNATLDGTRYHVECEVTPDSINKVWALNFCGQGRADVWASKTVIGTSNFVNDSTVNIFPNYIYPDYNQTMVSHWQCSDQVITVGNYVAKNAYLNYDSTITYNTENAGAIALNSSLGPTRDGRVKPDITAPGNFILACGNTRWVPVLISTGQGNKVAYGGSYVRNSGTSMASPQVAGAVALLLEQYPDLKPLQAREILRRTARLDTFTTNSIPNNTWGYGKLNTFQGMTYPAVFGCMDSTAYNYNSLANISDDNCIAKVYGCMDSTALNYNPLANTPSTTDTCVYATEVGLIDIIPNNILKVFPNPASDKVNFQLTFGFGIKSIMILDLQGRTVLTDTFTSKNYVWNCNLVARGVYFYKVSIGSRTYNGKIILN